MSQNPNSKRAQRKNNNKRSDKTNPPSSSSSSGDEDSNRTGRTPGKPQVASRPPGANKKQRTFNENDMNFELTAQHPPLSSLGSSSSAAQQGSAADSNGDSPSPSSPKSGNSPSASPTKNSDNRQSTPDGSPKNGSDAENPLDEDQEDQPTFMDTNRDNPSDDVTLLRASIAVSDVLQPDETRNHLLNRVKFYLTDRYPESFKNLRLQGSKEEQLLITLFKHELSSEFAALLSDNHSDLKFESAPSSPIFHQYDAAAIKADVIARTVIATDIPLFVKSSDVKASFAKHGTIQKFSIRTPPRSKFQRTTIVYTSPVPAERYKHIWILWCKCQCFRIHPANFTRDQINERLNITAVLRNLPPNIDAMDLARIFSSCNSG